eukprot:4594326-Amphidinium_carterae.1
MHAANELLRLHACWHCCGVGFDVHEDTGQGAKPSAGRGLPRSDLSKSVSWWGQSCVELESEPQI